MGAFDALVNKPVGTGSFAAIADIYTPDERVLISITHDTPTRSGGNTGGANVTAYGTFVATIFRRAEQTINVDPAAVGSPTVETNSVVVAISFADNPTVTTWIDNLGNCIIRETDKLVVLTSGVLTDLNGPSAAVIERVRIYTDGLQIDIRLGTG